MLCVPSFVAAQTLLLSAIYFSLTVECKYAFEVDTDERRGSASLCRYTKWPLSFARSRKIIRGLYTRLFFIEVLLVYHRARVFVVHWETPRFHGARNTACARIRLIVQAFTIFSPFNILVHCAFVRFLYTVVRIVARTCITFTGNILLWRLDCYSCTFVLGAYCIYLLVIYQ